MNVRKHTISSKVGYGLIDVLGGGSFALISLLFLNFLITVEGIHPALAGVILLIGSIWDALTDPLMGILSDSTRSRFGRRRVYLLAGVFPVILFFALLWYSFGISSMTWRFVYYVVIYILFTSASTLVMVPYNALLPDMVAGYKTRSGYVSIRMFISALAATISVTVPSLLLGAEGDRTARSYLLMGIVFGLFYGLPILVGFFTTWENPVPVDEERLTLREMRRRFGQSFRNRAYRQYLGIFCFGQMATDFVTAMAVFWLVDVLGRQGLLTLFSGILMAATILMLPVNNWIAKRYGKQVPSFALMPFRVVALAIAFFMGADSPMWLLVLVCVFCGIGNGASSFVPWSLLPDLPDSDEMINGSRNAGIFAGMATLVRKVSGGVAIFLAGAALSLFGYVQSVAGLTIEQTDTAIMGVRILFAAVSALLSLIVVFLGPRYALTKQNHAAILEAVTHRRETGKPAADPSVIEACERVSGRPFETLWVGKEAE